MTKSANFWIIASAISSFYKRHNLLPLPGSLPDMKAQSADYIRLQNVYRAKAKQDLAEITAMIRDKEKELGREDKPVIDDKEIEAFCKGAAWVKLIRGRPLQVVRYNAPGSTGSWADRASFACMPFLPPPSSALSQRCTEGGTNTIADLNCSFKIKSYRTQTRSFLCTSCFWPTPLSSSTTRNLKQPPRTTRRKTANN